MSSATPKPYPGCDDDDPVTLAALAQLAAAPFGPVDHARIKNAVREILYAVGEDPDREGLQETPDRVARMYAEVFAGLEGAIWDTVHTDDPLG